MTESREKDTTPKTATITLEQFERLVKEYGPAAEAHIWSIVKDRQIAEDIAQEAFASTWKNIHKVRGEAEFLPWVKTTAKNLALNYVKKHTRRLNIFHSITQNLYATVTQKEMSSDPQDEVTELSEADYHATKKALFSLPEELRKVYFLKSITGKSFEEIAEILDMDVELVELRHKEAKYRLSKRMNSMAVLFLTADTGRPGIVERVMAEITQVDPVTVATTGATATGVSWSLSGILASVALPFLWIFSFLISGQACGTAFIREAPALQTRRWLTKQLCALCCIIACVPLFAIVGYYLVFVSYFEWNRILSGTLYVSSLTIVLGIWLAKTQKQYALVQINPEHNEVEYNNLKRFITFGGFLSTALFIAFLLIWICFLAIPGYQHSIQKELWEGKAAFISVAFCMGVMIIGMQTSNFFLFRYFLRICKDNDTMKSTPLPLDSIPVSQRKRLFWEAAYIFPFVVYFIGPNLIHLLLVQKRILCPILEILFFASVWLVVFRYNLENPKTRIWRIIKVFVILFVIFHVLRQIYD